ncbi:twin-arginine translocation signal domain-containing protein [Sinirhodobacter huangdaonensis]|uniref:Twin-arginine translocation signal domain-containing protein n=1 Tax=Paenirhodobacter huangdaonensis TaxID=2501515 RepID=A0A3S3MQC4_9RHOB|nr:twin-arginine translocation signal domain-containing protein [Sinirhodobacter huangdaonensis]
MLRAYPFSEDRTLIRSQQRPQWARSGHAAARRAFLGGSAAASTCLALSRPSSQGTTLPNKP